MRITSSMVLFWRTADIYSNWYPSKFELGGVTYVNVEQYMMVAKARLFNCPDIVERLMALGPRDQAAMKALGRQVRGYVDEVWAAEREQAVYDACLAKFSQNPRLRAQLLATGELELVEASPVDRIWGIGLAEGDVRVHDKSKWRGLNLLGVVLMRVRATLRQSDAVRQGQPPHAAATQKNDIPPMAL